MNYPDPTPLLQKIIEERDHYPVEALKFALDAREVVSSIWQNVDGKVDAGYGATKNQIIALRNINSKAHYILKNQRQALSQLVEPKSKPSRVIASATATDILGITSARSLENNEVALEHEKDQSSQCVPKGNESCGGELLDNSPEVEMDCGEGDNTAITHELRQTPPAAFREKIKTLRLFHFTDTRNLSSINETGGLWSYAELKRKGIEPIAPGGSPSSRVQDNEQGLDEYVHLCLFPCHPMEYLCRTEDRIKQSLFIEISNKILESEGVLYTNEMANKQGVKKIPWVEAIEADEIGINIAFLFYSMGAEEQNEICRIAQQIKAYTVSDEQIDSDIYRIARLVAACIKQQLLVPKGISLNLLSLD